MRAVPSVCVRWYALLCPPVCVRVCSSPCGPFLPPSQNAREAVAPQLSMATCGWVLGPASNRTYFDGVLPADWTMSSIDRDVGK